MIPKIIHFCWFGGKPLPELAKRCIRSWKKYCPDYKIIRWDERNTDLNENAYIREAYDNKKWAFVTDYVRLKALFEIGGIYMDTDVQVCKPLDPFLKNKAFSGFENDHQIPTGIMASEKGHPFFSRLLQYYYGRHFVLEDGSYDMKTNVFSITEIALENGFVPNDTKQTICQMTFYPHDVFCPKDYKTGEVHSTKNTVCIHHFNGSWLDKRDKKEILLNQRLYRKFGKRGELFFKLYYCVVHPRKSVRLLRKRRMKQKNKCV